MAKKAYIILQHTFVPAPGQNTSMKNFGELGQWQMVEEIFFVTRIRKRWWREATTIVNLSDRKIETNRSETRDYNAIVQHVMMKYPEHYNNFIDECKESGLLQKGS
jgi:hypothetical protein